MTSKYLKRIHLGFKECEHVPFKFKFSTGHDITTKNSFLKKHVHDLENLKYKFEFSYIKYQSQGDVCPPNDYVTHSRNASSFRKIPPPLNKGETGDGDRGEAKSRLGGRVEKGWGRVKELGQWRR